MSTHYYKGLNGNNTGSGSATPYVTSFNTGGWTLQSGLYQIVIPKTTHNKTNTPVVEVLETNGLNFDVVTLHQITIAPNGDVTIKVLSTPDLRFDGKITIF